MRLPRVTFVAAALSIALLSGCTGQPDTPVETTTPPVALTPSASATATAEPSTSATPEPSASATAEPVPEPEPEDKEPVISTAGFGDVKLGAPVPAGLDYATWVPDYCPEGGAFVKAGAQPGDDYDYVIRNGKGMGDSRTGKVILILAVDSTVKTPSGVHIGQSLATVKAKLPKLKRIHTDYDYSKLYVVKDNLGQLTFEFRNNELRLITSLANNLEPFQIVGSDASSLCGV